MQYRSTRSSNEMHFRKSFSEVILEGLAPDGGLYVPCELPHLAPVDLWAWSQCTYTELAAKILSLFAPELEDEMDCSIQDLLAESTENFRSHDIVPLHKLDSQLYVGELFHGPTYAFKDIALQFLGRLFEHLLAKRDKNLSLLGATSGDTGGAAIYGVRNCQNLQLAVLHPHQAVSSVQRQQMCTVLADNICNIAVRGTFDDCQALVKSIMGQSGDGIPHLGAINSINWGRIVAQVTYYFALYFQLYRTDGNRNPGPHVHFVVPSGNFGNALAGYLAKRMGLPIHLVIATNHNDILYQTFSSGYYRPQKARSSFAPAMDIVQPSNFERYYSYLVDSDIKALRDFIDAAKTNPGESSRGVQLSAEMRTSIQKDFQAARSSDEEILGAMALAYERYQYALDPHTACAFSAVEQLGLARRGEPVILLATAHPAKFPEARSALEAFCARRGQALPASQLPAGLDFSGKEERYAILNNDAEEIIRYLKPFWFR